MASKRPIRRTSWVDALFILLALAAVTAVLAPGAIRCLSEHSCIPKREPPSRHLTL